MQDSIITQLTPEEFEAGQRAYAEEGGGLRHSIFRVWDFIFSRQEAESEARVRIDIAMHILGTWPQLDMGDIATYRAEYFRLLKRAGDAMTKLIPSNEVKQKNLNELFGEDDAKTNEAFYDAVLLAWEKQQMENEYRWDIAHPDAAAHAAAIADVGKFLMGREGIIEYLSSVGFTLSPEARKRHNSLLEDHFRKIQEG